MGKKARSKVGSKSRIGGQAGVSLYSSSISSCELLARAPEGEECAFAGAIVPARVGARRAAQSAPAGSPAVVGRADIL